MRTLRIIVLAAATITATVVPSASAQAATLLSAESAPTRVAAWNRTVVWSRHDPTTGGYELVKSVDGAAPTPVGVPQRPTPFDVDLGTSRLGSTYAVYTRDGDVYRLNVAAGVETKVGRLSSPTLAERDPTIQRGEIAFIRRERAWDQLRTGNTIGTSRGSRLVVRRRAIVGAELGIRHVAYVERSGPDRLVRVRNLRTGRDRVVYRARSGGANFANVTRPTFADDARALGASLGSFVWARTNLGSGSGNRLVRYVVRRSRLGYAQGSPRWSSTAWAGARLGAAVASSLTGGDSPGACVDAGVNFCGVALTGPVSFTPRP